MNPKELMLNTVSPIQRLEESLRKSDRRTLDERMIEALKEGQRHLYKASLSSVERQLAEQMREEFELARRDFTGISPDESFQDRVNRFLREFGEQLEHVQLVPDETTAHHESGHLVVGYVCGSKVGGRITCCEHEIKGAGSVWGFAEFAEHPSVSARVMTLLAGPLAELRFTASRTAPRDFRFDTSYAPVWGDRLTYGRILAPWNVQTEDEFGDAMKVLTEAGRSSSFAKVLSNTQEALNDSAVWQAIETLAESLFKAKLLTGAEAVDIISRFVKPPHSQ